MTVDVARLKQSWHLVAAHGDLRHALTSFGGDLAVDHVRPDNRGLVVPLPHTLKEPFRSHVRLQSPAALADQETATIRKRAASLADGH